MAKRFVVAIWMALVLLLAGLLFAIHLAVLGVALIVFEFAMGIAIAVWRPDRARAGAAAGAGPARSTAGAAAPGPPPGPAAGPVAGAAAIGNPAGSHRAGAPPGAPARPGGRSGLTVPAGRGAAKPRAGGGAKPAGGRHGAGYRHPLQLGVRVDHLGCRRATPRRAGRQPTKTFCKLLCPEMRCSGPRRTVARVVAGGGARTRGRRAGLVRRALQHRCMHTRSGRAGRTAPTGTRGRTASFSSKLRSTAALTAPTPTPSPAGRDAAVAVPADRPAVEDRRAGGGAGAAAPPRDTASPEPLDWTRSITSERSRHRAARRMLRYWWMAPLTLVVAVSTFLAGLFLAPLDVTPPPAARPAVLLDVLGRPVTAVRAPATPQEVPGEAITDVVRSAVVAAVDPGSSRGPASIRSRLSGPPGTTLPAGAAATTPSPSATSPARSSTATRTCPRPAPRRWGCGWSSGFPVRRSSPGT